MTIRPMRAEDIAAVMVIAAALPHAPNWPQSAYQSALDPSANPQRIALAAVDEQARIIGFIVLVLIAGEAELESIAVAPQAQRRGIAAALVNSAIDTLKFRQCAAILLEVRASNYPARALYAKFGFAEMARRTGYYASPPEDAVLMRLII